MRDNDTLEETFFYKQKRDSQATERKGMLSVPGVFDFRRGSKLAIGPPGAERSTG